MNWRVTFDDLAIMWWAQSESKAKVGKHRHTVNYIAGAGVGAGSVAGVVSAAAATCTVPPLVVHSSALAASITPVPLQVFWPLQLFLSVWQLPWALHALIPRHATAAVFSVAVGVVVLVDALLPHAEAKRLAAAIAVMVPVRIGFFIVRICTTNPKNVTASGPYFGRFFDRCRDVTASNILYAGRFAPFQVQPFVHVHVTMRPEEQRRLPLIQAQLQLNFLGQIE